MGRFMNGKFVYWGEPLTGFRIRLRKAESILGKFEAIGALVFSVGFLILFFWSVFTRGLLLDIFDIVFWQTKGNTVQLLFWLSIVSLSYLLYRVLASKRPLVLVDIPEYGDVDKSAGEETGVTPHRLEEGVKQSKRKTKDIAKTFTGEARAVLEEGYIIAEKHGEKKVGTYHIFYALLFSPKVQELFVRMDVPAKTLQAHIAKGFANTPVKGNQPVISENVKQIIFQAYEYARGARQEYVHLTELLLAAVDQSEQLQELLYDLKIDKQKLVNVVEWLRIRERLQRQRQKFRKAASRRSKYGLDKAMTAVATPFLNSFSQDLTLAAKFGHLASCVARDKEIEEIFRIIEGGRQSVVLVGETGVGKMSIIEGIAQLMVEEKVPERIYDKRLVQLSTSSLLAGTTVSGAQERLINMMQEIAKAGNIILFIKNIHDLVSSGGAEGAEGLDVSETLAEFLGSNRFLTFATTSVNAYNQHILNKELGSVLSRVDVKVMDENQAIQVLESKAGMLEYKHHVFFSYGAIEQSVKLASRFLHDQNLPESAIELMTEAAAFTRQNRGENHLVEADDVAAIVGSKTGIPTANITEDESSKLLRLEEEMHKRVIGQTHAVQLVANALRRARAQIRSQSRPIANFLFLGPTGVGKTELAKTIASIYFGGKERMVRIDMSEYQDKSGIYRLIGQPGKQGTGLLTEAVRQKPFSLVLLDEMEKADPDILNLFLQVFDDGRLTDSVGRVIDFTNTIIIATSNAGTNYVQEQLTQGVTLEDIRQKLVRGELKKYYRPEFLNRFDGIVLFKPLERDEIKQIAGLMLKRVDRDLEQKGVRLRVEDAALEALAQVGFDPEFGARPMRRAIQEHVENKLAELVLAGKLNRRDIIVLGEGAKIRIERG